MTNRRPTEQVREYRVTSYVDVFARSPDEAITAHHRPRTRTVTTVELLPDPDEDGEAPDAPTA